MLDDPDARLPHPTVLRIWRELAALSGDQALQLRAPRLPPYGAYRVLDYLVVATPTLGEWFPLFARYFRLINNGVDLQVRWEDERPCLDMRMMDGSACEPVYVEYTFAAFLERTRLRAHPGWNPSLVEFRHPVPRDLGPYRSVFNCPVVFDASGDRLWCRIEDWGRRSAEADAPLGLLLEEHARLLTEAMPIHGGFVSAVRSLITEVLSEGAPTALVAKKLAMSVRSLQRRLAEEGTTYSAVLDSIREELARRYLSDSDVAISEVAFLLGFSEQSSFHRAFKRWTGVAPGEWRNRSRG
ncbi:MAG: AraC family transcriptional regulator [Planctomycetota bacterium]